MCTPCTLHVEAQQCAGVVAYDIVEIGILKSHAVAVAATVEGAHLVGCGATQTVVDQLIEECRGVQTQTLVQGVLGILVILQDASDAVDIAVKGLHRAVTVDGHTGKDEVVVTVAGHTKRAELRGQCVVGHVAVNPQVLRRLGVGLPHLQQRVGQQGFEILLRLVAEAEVPVGVVGRILIDDAVDRHAGTQDVVSHKHVDHVELVGIVVAGADLDTILADVVIPGATVAVPLYALLLQVVETVDACSTESLVGLGKDCPLHQALLGIVQRVAVAVVVVVTHVVSLGRAVLIILLFYEQRVGISRSL